MGFFPTFNATKVAGAAFIGDFATKPYYNAGFHLDSLISLVCHVVRTVYDLAASALRLAITPLQILNPLTWVGLPCHLLEIVDDAVGAVISAVTIPTTVVCMVLRTLHSLFSGYQEKTGCMTDDDLKGDKESLEAACSIF